MEKTLFRESETTDYKEFVKSLQQLHGHLKNRDLYDNRSVVITLSRKGPMMLEVHLEGEASDDFSKLNVVTEFAIPFLMRSLHKEVRYRFYIVDDAVYFGSTLKNLIGEIREYEHLYGLQIDVKALVATIDRGASQLDNVEGLRGHRDGFGHYFVRQVMASFRSLHRCMEVEFPVVSYRLDRVADLQQLVDTLKKHSLKAYVNDYAEEQVLTILLNETGCQFCKIRVYTEGKVMHLAVMAPRNLSDDYSELLQVMDAFGSEYQSLWRQLCESIPEKAGVLMTDVILREGKHSLVVMANFIFSFHVFIGYRALVESILRENGYVFSRFSFSVRSVYRLTGLWSFSELLTRLLLQDADSFSRRIPSQYKRVHTDDWQIYEENYFPTLEDRSVLASHNYHMIRNSSSLQEALSAVVFNQNLFVERWSRYGLHSEKRRLWFGYTHDTLGTMTRRCANFQIDNSLQQQLHRWLDWRIDQGCVVPQYIVDAGKHQWVRVFRPGENEDVILSHLSRFVLSVFVMIDKQMNKGYVPLCVLENMLAVVYKKLWLQELAGQFIFDLVLDDRTLYMVEEDRRSSQSVLDYLRKMYILEINDQIVNIAPRLSDPEFLSNTTLNQQVSEHVKTLVESLMQDYSAWGISDSASDSFFNYYLNETLDATQYQMISNRIGNRLRHVLMRIENALASGSECVVKSADENELLSCYHELGKYDVHKNFYRPTEGNNVRAGNVDVDKNFLHFQRQCKSMLLIVNVIAAVYLLPNQVDAKAFFSTDNIKESMSGLKLFELLHYIEETRRTGNYRLLSRSTRLPSVLKVTLDKIL